MNPTSYSTRAKTLKDVRPLSGSSRYSSIMTPTLNKTSTSKPSSSGSLTDEIASPQTPKFYPSTSTKEIFNNLADIAHRTMQISIDRNPTSSEELSPSKRKHSTKNGGNYVDIINVKAQECQEVQSIVRNR